MTVAWPRLLQLVADFVSSVHGLLGAARRSVDLLRIGGAESLRRRLSHGGLPFRGDYAAWIRRYDRLSEKDRRAIDEDIAAFTHRPLISLWTAPGPNGEASIQRTVGSLRAQLYPYWEFRILLAAGTERSDMGLYSRLADEDERIECIVAGAPRPETRSAPAQQRPGDTYVATIEPGDILSAHALYLIARALEDDPGHDIIYTDEDRIDQHGARSSPWFKTDWNFDLMLSQDCVGSPAFLRESLLRATGWQPKPGTGTVHLYSALLHAAALTTRARIHHVPVVAFHRRQEAGADLPLPGPQELRDEKIAATLRFLRHQKSNASVSLDEVHGYQRVTWAVPDPKPKVSIIIPTKDSAVLLDVAVDSILRRTDYENYEIIIVDNNSIESETHQLFQRLGADHRVRILPYHFEYNFAALNNFAISQCDGKLVALVNNDVEVITPDWLTEMVGHALRQSVGAVGARLFYYDNTLQHGGVVIGAGGLAAHAHVGLSRDDPGYFGRAVCTQELSAVTAACMVLRRSVYTEVGGLDEESFAIAYNDIDLCLRLRQLGYSIVWTPYAELYHRESASLGAPLAAKRRRRFLKEAAALRARWDTDATPDPFYNSNLSLRPADFSLAAPRAARAWRARAARPPRHEALVPREEHKQ